jgi:hypothetical protein
MALMSPTSGVASAAAARELMKEAIEGHLECKRDFYEIPKPTTVAEGIEVPVNAERRPAVDTV